MSRSPAQIRRPKGDLMPHHIATRSKIICLQSSVCHVIVLMWQFRTVCTMPILPDFPFYPTKTDGNQSFKQSNDHQLARQSQRNMPCRASCFPHLLLGHSSSGMTQLICNNATDIILEPLQSPRVPSQQHITFGYYNARAISVGSTAMDELHPKPDIFTAE